MLAHLDERIPEDFLKSNLAELLIRRLAGLERGSETSPSNVGQALRDPKMAGFMGTGSGLSSAADKKMS